MGKKLPYTPNSKIYSALRRIFLYSREHQAILKESNRTCSSCGSKASVAKGKECKVEVHHKSGINNWNKMVELIRKELLNKNDFVVLCKECHNKIHEKEK